MINTNTHKTRTKTRRIKMTETKKAPHYFTLEQMATFDNMSDDKSPNFTFQGTDSQILSMIVKGEIDPVAMAWKELANRGLDHCGEWVGFNQASKIFEASVVQNMKL